MPIYRLKPGFKHYENKQRMKAGETLEMTEERFVNANLKDRFVLVGSNSEPDSVESTEDESTEETENQVPVSQSNVNSTSTSDWSFIKHKKQQEVLDLISTVEDKETVTKIYESEESGKNREKVLEAARAKFLELGG